MSSELPMSIDPSFIVPLSRVQSMTNIQHSTFKLEKFVFADRSGGFWGFFLPDKAELCPSARPEFDHHVPEFDQFDHPLH